MNIHMYHFDNGNSVSFKTTGSVSLTYDHLWDKQGRQPILLAHFDGDYWIHENTGHIYTDITISSDVMLGRYPE